MTINPTTPTSSGTFAAAAAAIAAKAPAIQTPAPAAKPKRKAGRSTAYAPQPLSVLAVDGALLKYATVGAITGQSRSTLIRAMDCGELQCVRLGVRCTRFSAEDVRAYLALCVEVKR